MGDFLKEIESNCNWMFMAIVKPLKLYKVDIYNYNGKDKKKVDEFYKTLSKISYINLDRFKHNTKTLKIKRKFNFLIYNIKYGCIKTGEYDAIKNIISTKYSSKDTSINHELLHLASTYSNKKVYQIGFFQKANKNPQIGNGINEGYTNLLDKRYFNFNNPYCYPIETKIMETIELIIGKEKMEQYYFSGDLYQLIKDLEKYLFHSDIMSFIISMDYFTRYSNVKGKSEIDNLCDEYYCNMCYFVTKLYYSKIVQDLEDNNIDNIKKLIHNLKDLLDYKCIINDKIYTATKYSKINKIIDAYTKEIEKYDGVKNDR